MAGCTANRAVLVLLTRKATAWPDSLAGPGLKVAQPVTVCAPASSLTAGGLLAVKLGRSLTGLTVSVNVSGADVPPAPVAGPAVCRAANEKVELPEAYAFGP